MESLPQKENKNTKGEVKMDRYIEDLIRNKDFIKSIKRLKRNEEKFDYWMASVEKEYVEIIDSYKVLKKKISKINKTDDYIKNRKAISIKYNLDLPQINYILSLFHDNHSKFKEFMKFSADLDMCKVFDLNEDQLNPRNEGSEIIYLNPAKELFLNAYPIGVFIHPSASKNDVLDFIEKKWEMIEHNFLRTYSLKKIKYGKRKHSQKLLDFIWVNRNLSSNKIKEKIDKEFPDNGLAYYEILDIKKTEKKKRLGKLT